MECICNILQVSIIKPYTALLLRLCWRENDEDVPFNVLSAFEKTERKQKAFKHRRSNFARSVGLAPAVKGDKLKGIPTIYLRRRSKAYPPYAHDIYETAETREIWEGYRARMLYPDRRGDMTWKPFHQLDPNCLQLIVEEDKSAIIRDNKSRELIGVVIRNFSNYNRRLLDWINEVIDENTGSRRSVRVGPIPYFALTTYLIFF